LLDILRHEEIRRAQIVDSWEQALISIEADRRRICLAINLGQERLSRSVVDLVLEWKRNKVED